MKKYKQFINESISDKFRFAVDITNITDDQIDKLFDMIYKKSVNYDEYSEFGKSELLSLRYKKDIFGSNSFFPWALGFEITDYFNRCRIDISTVTTPRWGAGYTYMECILSLDEFFKVGFEGAEELVKAKEEIINMKKDANKFNI